MHFLATLKFSLAEFINIIFGGIVTGIIAALIYTLLEHLIKRYRFDKSYGSLRTASKNERDWKCFSMEDNQFCNRVPLSSNARVTVHNCRISINVLQSDNRKWNGVISIMGPNWGKMNYRYYNELEFGFKDCFMGPYLENGKAYNYFYLIPNDPGYGRELLLREIQN